MKFMAVVKSVTVLRATHRVDQDRMDSEQLQHLIDTHGAPLLLYARQWCRFPEDALQDAFVELIQLETRPANVVGWLYKTVRWRALNFARGESRRSKYHRIAADGQQGCSLKAVQTIRRIHRLPSEASFRFDHGKTLSSLRRHNGVS